MSIYYSIYRLSRYNENKPVSSSRDTQEIYSSAGAEMLKIFQEYKYESSILDDFDFYELQQQKMENLSNDYIPQEERLNIKIKPCIEEEFNECDKISRKYSDSIDNVQKYFSNINLNQEYGLGKYLLS